MFLELVRSSKDRVLLSKGYGRKDNLHWKVKVEKKEEMRISIY